MVDIKLAIEIFEQIFTDPNLPACMNNARASVASA